VRSRVPSAILRGRALAIVPDASAAAFPLAAAAITGGDVALLGLGRGSLQGDIRFAELLAEMGCAVEGGEERIRVRGGPLRAIDVDLAETPDLVPPLAAVAAFAEGRSTLRGIAHLRHKESDRLAVLAAGLTALGFPARAGADSLEIDGGAAGRGAVVDPAGDHRMAMAFAVIGTRLPGVRIRDPGCVAKSDPEFFGRLEGLLGGRERAPGPGTG
jgi:3-phosphoshikimate 1-carboxyvinyltransferase